MRARPFIWLLLGLLLLAGAWFFWRQDSRRLARQKVTPPVQVVHSASTAPAFVTGKTISTNMAAAAPQKKFAHRLSNTTKSIGQLLRDDKAILLENALIDTRDAVNFSVPANLKSPDDPGTYIVQSSAPLDNNFRALLASAGATIVSYIPNNAYLVRMPASTANALAANPAVNPPVLPWEPVYKLKSTLLDLAMDQQSLPDDAALNVGLFADDAPATMQQIEKLGGQIVGQDRSPFGPIALVIPPKNWTSLALLPGVQIMELHHARAIANDLARVTLGVSTDTVTPTNYLNLYGSNVVVEVNDTGINPTNNTDFDTGLNPPMRVIGDFPESLSDLDGHGTHVAGIIAGNGTESDTVTTNTASGSVTNADFRGKAPLTTLFSVGFLGPEEEVSNVPDSYLQETPARTNALISNNSWGEIGNDTYDLSAASFDAAVRDALPEVTGSQPVLFVFAAGNNGGALDDSGFGGNPDTISSPATAKNVISVGATEQLRNITNMVTNLDGTVSAFWQQMTDSSDEVASFSSRGNVGIGIEGSSGRFKPDVIAPGVFVISDRSANWDQPAYYNPTNFDDLDAPNQVVLGDSINFSSVSIPENVVQVLIQIAPNELSPNPFPNMPILVWQGTDPRNGPPNVSKTNSVSIPPDSALAPVGTTWNIGVSNGTSQVVSYDLQVELVTTNDNGNLFTVLSNLNDTLGPFYRYESGTSMAAPAVSGVLALMQDYFTNTLHTLPSPALLKAMLINGARSTGGYNFQVQNAINFQGWGMANLPDVLPPGITDQFNLSCSSFFLDQSPTNALATGDRQTYFVSVTNADAQAQPLRVTLVWTDPPGNPAASIKLVNDLDLVVTNLDDPTTPVIYYGNDIGADVFNTPEDTNATPNVDSINNVENVYISPLLGTNYSITVIGHRVNVNAVTTQTNNVVQDYALVVSCGDGSVTNAMTVTTNAPPGVPGGPSFVSNSTGDQQITFVTTGPDGSGNNGPLLNQLVGANTPLLGTNSLLLTNAVVVNGETNQQITIGMTNQWHFYVVTNSAASTNADFTNAAFVTFIPDTLSLPREGVFADTQDNATRPEADIDLYVATEPGLTNLDPNVIANCINGVGNDRASLSRGGTEVVTYSNSTPGQVFYVGVKSEDQNAAEYGFLSVFTAQPFSVTDSNGVETVNGLLLPSNIPDGSPAVPGIDYIFAIAAQPIDVGSVIVTNQIWHQNFGDLIGKLTHGSMFDILNNHDSRGNTIGSLPSVYDDSGQGLFPGSQPSDGPGSLNDFIGQQGAGAWILAEADDSLTQTGTVQQFSLVLEPHLDLEDGHTVKVPGNGSFIDFIDVPQGATNLTITVTNFTGTANPPLELLVKLGSLPTTNDFDEIAIISNGVPPSGSISIGPPLASGRYFVEIFNPSPTPQDNVFIIATLGIGNAPAQVVFSSSGPVPLLDDAVTTNSIFVTQDKIISSVDVALRVDHPRVSDLVFHLISPDGTRVLLVENRGGTTTNGMGATLTASNTVLQAQTSSGSGAASTNVINTGQTSGTLTVSFDFFNIPDEMLVLDQNGNTQFDSGEVSGSGVFTIPYNNAPLTIVMNPAGNGGAGDLWDYTVEATGPQYEYLVLTEDTNKTVTPIKFAPPPFSSTNLTTNADLFYLPEQPMDPLAGENANGQWILEVQDDRAGATNPAPTLLSWQLRFNFTTATPTAGLLTNGVAQTNVVPANSIAYYLVAVPTNADFATNLLFSTGGPLNLWFNQTAQPSGTNSPGDFLLLTNSTGGAAVLSTNGVPPLVPGQSYFLAVQNTNAANVTYSIEVDFHLLPTSAITNFPISGIVFTNENSTNGILLTWFAPTNYQFQVQWTTNLASPILWSTVAGVTLTNLSSFTPTNGVGEFQFFDDGSLTGGFGPIKFYRLIAFPPGVPMPQVEASSVSISDVQFIAGNIQFQWSAPPDGQFEIRWTTNLAVPLANWFILTNPVLGVSNGVFTFTDTNQTGPPASTKFFRVIEVP